MKGLHIIGDLYNCAPNEFLISAKALRTLCVGACKTAGLSVLGDQTIQIKSTMFSYFQDSSSEFSNMERGRSLTR